MSKRRKATQEVKQLIESLNEEEKIEFAASDFRGRNQNDKSEPSRVAEKVGLKTRATEEFYDLAIVGGGPAGLAAAVYGASKVCGRL
jgi:thioredoxin reductase (NADPH)